MNIRRKGYSAKQAAFHAGLARFRPVVLTAITTILGLVPMVFELTIQFADRSILSAHLPRNGGQIYQAR